MKKRLFTLLAVTLLAINIVACGQEVIDPLSQDTMDKITALGDITLDDEAAIINLETTYSEMTDHQKEQVTNYVDLKNARQTIEALKEAEQAKLDEQASKPPYGFAIQLCKKIKESCYNSDSFEVKNIVYVVDDKTDGVYWYRITFVAQNKMGGNTSEDVIAVYADGDKSSKICTEDDFDFAGMSIYMTTEALKGNEKSLDLDFVNMYL